MSLDWYTEYIASDEAENLELLQEEIQDVEKSLLTTPSGSQRCRLESGLQVLTQLSQCQHQYGNPLDNGLLECVNCGMWVGDPTSQVGGEINRLSLQ